jgi:hypothetical protein
MTILEENEEQQDQFACFSINQSTKSTKSTILYQNENFIAKFPSSLEEALEQENFIVEQYFDNPRFQMLNISKQELRESI